MHLELRGRMYLAKIDEDALVPIPDAVIDLEVLLLHCTSWRI